MAIPTAFVLTVNRLCGVSGQTSKFRNFEVTDDGEYAFFIHQSMDGAGGPDLCVVATAVRPTSPSCGCGGHGGHGGAPDMGGMM